MMEYLDKNLFFFITMKFTFKNPDSENCLKVTLKQMDIYHPILKGRRES